MFYRDQIEELRREMADQREMLSKELKNLPEGQLFVQSADEGAYVYRRIPATGNRKKEHRYGITNDRKMIGELLRKKYITKALTLLDKDAALLDKVLEKYRPFDEQTLMSELRHEYPKLDAALFDIRTRLDAWASQWQPVEGFYEEDKRSVTAKGDPVRSKNELYIASRLDYYNIPYRYEQPLAIPDLSYVPDFTIKRRRDGMTIYWEHFGRVNDRKYMNDNERKLFDYKDYGIVPWKNLIVTYDYENGGLNAKLIEAMIQAWLL